MPKTNTIPRTTYKKIILELLPQGHPVIQQAAKKLSIPVRTLQRRLHDAGLTYSELVDEVRCDAACHLLKTEGSCLADIAAALGFSDPSNFSRAFQRWKGMSPSEFRTKLPVKRAKNPHNDGLQANGAK